MLSRFSGVWLFVTLWTEACQAPLSMGILQARILESVAMLSSGDLPNPGMESASLMSPALAGGFFTTSATWEAHFLFSQMLYHKIYRVRPVSWNLMKFYHHPCVKVWKSDFVSKSERQGACGYVSEIASFGHIFWWGRGDSVDFPRIRFWEEWTQDENLEGSFHSDWSSLPRDLNLVLCQLV